jgi:hypothetical protein
LKTIRRFLRRSILLTAAFAFTAARGGEISFIDLE